MVSGVVEGDGDDPGRPRRDLVTRLCLLPGPEEGLLQRLLGERRISAYERNGGRKSRTVNSLEPFHLVTHEG